MKTSKVPVRVIFKSGKNVKSNSIQRKKPLQQREAY